MCGRACAYTRLCVGRPATPPKAVMNSVVLGQT